jgi:single-stranded-DNA-specific exonuclease
MFHRPVVLVSTKDNIGKGSARSIPGFDLYEGLSACSDVLEKFGGHSMAAGLTIKTDKIDMFQSMLEKAVRKMTKPEDFMPVIPVDFVLDFADIKDQLIHQLESLKPFGANNPEPVFISKDIKVLSSKIVGENHRRMLLKQINCKIDIGFQAIHFNVDQNIPEKDYYDEIAYNLRWNYWNSKKTVQIVIEDM